MSRFLKRFFNLKINPWSLNFKVKSREVVEDTSSDQQVDYEVPENAEPRQLTHGGKIVFDTALKGKKHTG